MVRREKCTDNHCRHRMSPHLDMTRMKAQIKAFQYFTLSKQSTKRGELTSLKVVGGLSRTLDVVGLAIFGFGGLNIRPENCSIPR